jgi:hypothetical protein
MTASQIVLDRERIRDGMRAGQPTAAYLLIIDDHQVVWRGFNRDRALEAAQSWIDRGAAFLDMTEAR